MLTQSDRLFKDGAQAMASKIQWRFMFRVNNRRAFEKCLGLVLEVLGSGCEPSEGKPYWKVPELWECSVVVPVHLGPAAEQIMGCLVTACRLASGWYVLGALSPDRVEGFSGVFGVGHGSARSHVVGLEWASFELM